MINTPKKQPIHDLKSRRQNLFLQIKGIEKQFDALKEKMTVLNAQIKSAVRSGRQKKTDQKTVEELRQKIGL
ncbi:MAG: hypothetical protein COU31_02625 [Candidatus Magasanikbacteria bacterium CG10_big_fil_rev_8_21_14_0_10_40_10]|uniref:Uncharacterized protein n=1 Tax=Candidatus Magasanikbacteria bacterium CG10_big_fil_rev_8_21_14_0_10_40_10 TaxID=1974648 RepID=A0A2M6W3X5_9BACT|nr:MAG: hypothetical protein COU31_02625 [Candidatus Magasanikbacteria bacterium CG10_big_fil_rev_8_21_14_0_10_40_10]